MGKKDILQQALWGLLVLLAACAPTVSQTPTVAQGPTPVQAPQVVTSLTPGEMEAILREAGYRYERVQVRGTEQLFGFSLRMGDLAALLFLVQCKGGRCESLQLLTPFGSRPTLERINAWNREKKRFSRAYLMDDGVPVLESYLGLKDGVTRETILSFLKTFEVSLSEFATWIGLR